MFRYYLEFVFLRRSRKNIGQLIWVLAKTDFKLRYHGSVLGFVWALLKPLLLFVILNLVFSHLFAAEVEFYSLQLLTAILMWNFFAEGTQLGLTSLMSKAHLLTKISFPRWVVVVASTLQSLMTFGINLIILLAAFWLFGVSLSIWQLLVFSLYLVTLYLLILAFSLLTAPLFIRYRDLNQIWDVILTAGFYFAPIIYPLSIIPSWLQPWLYLNPMTFLIEHSRGVIFLGQWSRADHHLFYLGFVLVFLIFAWKVFKRFDTRIVELL